jgi:diguanylate cyclase (GGDEF)-like protein/PAS domain S-box-containing protein
MTLDASPGPARIDDPSAAPLLRAALESTTDGVLVLDERGNVVTSNGRFAEIFGGHSPSIVRAAVADTAQAENAFDTLVLDDGRVLERTCRALKLDGRSGRLWTFRDVTESRRAEEQLRESEERFRLIAENVGDLVAMIDPAGRRLYNSPSYKTLFAPADITLGTDSFREIHPDDRERIQEIFRETVRSGVGRRAEFRFVLRDGSIRHIESEGRVICDAAGKVSKVVVVSRDISDRKRAEQRQKMEHGVTRVLAEAESLGDAIPRIIKTICETLEWDCGARWAMDDEHKAIRCMEAWTTAEPHMQQFAEDIRGMSLLPGHVGLVRQVWMSGEPKWITDISREGGFLRADHAARAGLHAAFAFPIQAGTLTLGVLEFFSRQTRQPDGALMQMVRVIGSQIGQFMARKQAEENLLYVATHDTLTGLPNRYMFNQRFAHAITQSQRYRRPLALLFMDLDRFKLINDTLGHPFGDQLLVEVGRRLRSCFRDSDTVARFGGDEFVALIPEFAAPTDVVSVAQKMLDVIRKPYRIDGRDCHVTGSVGISLFPDDGQDLATLLKNADIAIYKAKEKGRNNYVFHSEEMNESLVQQVGLEAGLQRAIQRDEFVLHYQPKVELGSGRITGMEALIRWQHPELGLIAPEQFIPLAEHSGHIIPIGDWVLQDACQSMSDLRNGHGPRLHVSVNLSARQFEDDQLLPKIQRALIDTGLPPACLQLEITESMVMKDAGNAARILKEVKAMGISLALDDFGTGYSSLASIRQFPFDCIKIDRSFIQDLPGNGDDAAITRAIISMAQSLRLRVIAEGVETREQVDLLHRMGCHEFQGFFFRRAEPLAEIYDLVCQSRQPVSSGK